MYAEGPSFYGENIILVACNVIEIIRELSFVDFKQGVTTALKQNKHQPLNKISQVPPFIAALIYLWETNSLDSLYTQTSGALPPPHYDKRLQNYDS